MEKVHLERLRNSKSSEWTDMDCVDAIKEIDRLRNCLKKANELAEHFERKWYLQGDKLEKVEELLKEANPQIRMNWNGTVNETQQKIKKYFEEKEIE